jgi:hypothetical protein
MNRPLLRKNILAVPLVDGRQEKMEEKKYQGIKPIKIISPQSTPREQRDEYSKIYIFILSWV